MRIVLLSLLLATLTPAFSQKLYFQQGVQYDIQVQLDDRSKVLRGFERIIYMNNSPDTLNFIWFHLWPNAYKNTSTALFRQIKNDKERKLKLKNIQHGYIDSLSFRVNDMAAVTEPHPEPDYIDVVKLILPSPLLPGDSVVITTPFKVVLPSYFSRGGYADGEFMITQWYPKPAVYDRKGWHEMPYLDMGEFFSNIANFTVEITVPSAYVVASTGVLMDSVESHIYKDLGSKNLQGYSKPALYKPIERNANKTLRYTADSVPDFAWFADKNYIILYDTIQLSPGRVVDAYSYFYDRKNTTWAKSMEYIKDATRKFSEWLGDYAYPQVSAVEGPKNNSSGGMEYPMVTLITSPNAKPKTLDIVIAHEVGHNWFMAFLATNERQHAWMDEGLTTYYQFRYEAEKYKSNEILDEVMPESLKTLPTETFLSVVYQSLSQIPFEAAVETPSASFKDSEEYGITSYVKAALWMYILEQTVGKDKLDAAMKNFFNNWKFGHPYPEDFKASLEESIQLGLDEVFALLKKKGKF